MNVVLNFLMAFAFLILLHSLIVSKVHLSEVPKDPFIVDLSAWQTSAKEEK